MKKLLYLVSIVVVIAFPGFKTHNAEITGCSLFTIHHSSFTTDTIHFPDEKHFKNVQQLTFGGDNAEAYWSSDSKRITFQRTNAKEGLMCDQIFIGKVPQKPGEKFTYKMVSTGKGRTTCSFFTKD